jgi:hypothetical protein
MDELVPLTEKLLEVPQQLIRAALQLELQGTVIADHNHIDERRAHF